MACPAVEHGKAIKASNDARLLELAKQIVAAGVMEQVNEYLYILDMPNAAFSARIEKSNKSLA